MGSYLGSNYDQWRGRSVEVTISGTLRPGKPGDFSAALRSVRAGKKVRRAAWPGGTYLRLFEPELAEPPAVEACQPHVVCWRADGTAIPYSVGHDSLLAEDWELVE